jgi:hypothetical protein
VNKFLETYLDSFDQLFLSDRFFWSPFVYRGQNSASYQLRTSIERAIEDFSKFNWTNDYKVDEQWMMHEFKRKYPLFSNILPKQNDSFEWLAIMQHHGAPTRLLDFTESIFIAIYFAICDAKDDAAVWVVNRLVLRDNLFDKQNLLYNKDEALKDDVNDVHIDFANKFIGNKTGIKENEIPMSVIPLEPKICTERLAKQQGLFLMPADSSVSFMDNLTASYNQTKFLPEEISFTDLIDYANKVNIDNDVEIIKICIPKELHCDILDSLHQMNITAETLFPGIDGLAKSLLHSHIRI